MATAELITSNRMTRANPGGAGYRLPLINNGEFRFNGTGCSMAAFGDAVDKLGQIEDMFTMKELEELYRRKEAGQL